jgi:hypothetical protein
MAIKWNHTVEVITEVETAKAKGQWKIGDAIIKDLKDHGYLGSDAHLGGPSEIENTVFSDCTEKLAEKGIEHNGKPYDANYLRQLFQTAYAFPRDERNSKYSWDAHHEAGSPTNLKNAATALRKMDKTVTIYNVRDVIKKWSNDAAAVRHKAHEEALAKKDAAKKKKAAASAEKLRTKDETKRAEAEAARVAAQKEFDEAKAAIKATGSPPPFNADIDVDVTDTSELVRLALYLGLTVHVNNMKREAKKMLKDVGVLAKHLTNSEQEEVSDSVSEIVAILEEINTLANRPARKYPVIAGGRA